MPDSPLSPVPNGVRTPVTPPRMTNFSLTENTTSISDAGSLNQPKPQFLVPDHFLLPNGYPDV